MNTKAKLRPLGGEQDFIEKKSSDLVFKQIWPIFQLDQNIIKTNILVKFLEN